MDDPESQEQGILTDWLWELKVDEGLREKIVEETAQGGTIPQTVLSLMEKELNQRDSQTPLTPPAAQIDRILGYRDFLTTMENTLANLDPKKRQVYVKKVLKIETSLGRQFKGGLRLQSQQLAQDQNNLEILREDLTGLILADYLVEHAREQYGPDSGQALGFQTAARHYEALHKEVGMATVA